VKEFFPEVTLVSRPRRNAFNVSYNGELLWDGLSKGPPRALKFEILQGRNLFSLITGAASQ